MASRRNRIKGIANIPQRRKPVNILASDVHVEKVPKIEPEICEDEPNLVSVKPETDTESCDTVEPKQEITDSPDVKDIEANQQINCATDVAVKTTELPNDQPKEVPKAAVPIRRRFVKPTVSSSILNRRTKPPPNISPTNDTVKTTETAAAAKEKVSVDVPAVETEQIRSPKPAVAMSPKTDLPQLRSPETVNMTLNETAITPSNLPNNSITASPNTLLATSHISELDPSISIAPPSPTKINRSRIKAVPRLGQRRTSFSASESEDDGRRSYRNRNDSVCSAVSTTQDGTGDILRRKDYTYMVQRKCRRTEQSRKLAEARREFHLKFADRKPEKRELTMIDLIYYNPTTNPMSQGKKRNAEDDTSSRASTPLNEPLTEDVDDPKTEEEENDCPAPQIKIGADGEIVIDEKSVMIENKDTKKDREKLQKSNVIDGDFDTHYGVFKRVKRSKDWSPAETLRFYKALNTIGTDFTLMCELFPRRNRRELKLKFKKEEKTNRNLIDRAVLHPKNFDLTELKHEVEVEERELAEAQERKERRAERARNKQEKTSSNNKKGGVLAKQFDFASPPIKKVSRKSRVNTDDVYDNLSRGIDSVLDDSDIDSEDFNLDPNNTENSIAKDSNTTEESKLRKSERTCKRRKVIYDTENEEEVEEEKAEAETLEPGSIMVVPSQGENGETIYKVFMVTPGQNKTPIDLTPDVVERLMTTQPEMGENITNILTISEQEKEPIEEHNITIPADDIDLNTETNIVDYV